MAQPYNETLGFSALMITPLNKIYLKETLINVTHSNIITPDISNIFNNISSAIYRTFCYHKSIASVNDL